jgi:hypothetical protein
MIDSTNDVMPHKLDGVLGSYISTKTVSWPRRQKKTKKEEEKRKGKREKKHQSIA